MKNYSIIKCSFYFSTGENNADVTFSIHSTLHVYKLPKEAVSNAINLIPVYALLNTCSQFQNYIGIVSVNFGIPLLCIGVCRGVSRNGERGHGQPQQCKFES